MNGNLPMTQKVIVMLAVALFTMLEFAAIDQSHAELQMQYEISANQSILFWNSMAKYQREVFETSPAKE